MVMPTIIPDAKPISQPDQYGAMLRTLPCYDDLIAFIKSWQARTRWAEKPILQLLTYSGTSFDYQTLISWKVDKQAEGRLKELSLFTNSYDYSTYSITIAGISMPDILLPTAITLPFTDLRLMPESEVKVLVKSDGTHSIKASASLVGVELYQP